MATSTPSVANVALSASLIEDYLLTQQAPVATSLQGRFTVVQNGSAASVASELLTVNGNGNLVRFYPEPSSNSGWALETPTVPTPPNSASSSIGALAGFYHTDPATQASVLNALVYFPSSSPGANVAAWMQRTSDGTWSQAALTNTAANMVGATGQTDVFQDANGRNWFYGVSLTSAMPTFFIIGLNSNSQWDIAFTAELAYFPGNPSPAARFRLSAGANNTVTVLWVDGATISYKTGSLISYSSGPVQGWYFEWSDNSAPQQYSPGLGTISVTQLYALPGPAAASNFVLRSTSSVLYFVGGYNTGSPTATTLTGTAGQPTGASSASVGIDSTGMLRLFAVDSSDATLWIMRQNGTGTNGVPTFDPWVQLGDTLGTIACPGQMIAGPELFMVDLNETVYHLSQSVVDTSWLTRELAAPVASGAAPQLTATYTTELQAQDANGSAVSGALVSLTADRPAVVVVGGIAYQIGPDSPATIATDALGRATIAVEATGLVAPRLTCLVTNADGSTASRWAQGDTVQLLTSESALINPAAVGSRLAGQDPNFPVNSTVLQQQGLISPQYASGTGDPVQAINASGQFILQMAQSPNSQIHASKLTHPHFAIDFKHPDGPRFRVLTADEAQQILRGASSANQLGSASSLFGDVAHWLKHLWDKLDQFVASVSQDVLNIAFTIEGAVQNFVVKTIAEAGAALETVFTRIMEGLKDAYDVIKDAVNWLKQLFEWSDILNTHLVIKNCVLGMFNYAIGDGTTGGSLGNVQGWVDQEFAWLEGKVTDAFQNIEQLVEPSSSFNDFVTSAGASPFPNQPGPLDSTPVANANTMHASRNNYMSSKAHTYYQTSTSAVAAWRSLVADSDPTSSVQNYVNTNVNQGQFTTHADKLNDFVTSGVSNLKQFFDLAIVGLVNAAQDLVNFALTFVKDICDLFLQIAEEAISALRSALTANIDIPIISWIYRCVITGTPSNPGPEMSILDVLCLVLAVPATILYKVFNKDQAPFQSGDADQFANLPWPALPAAGTTGAALLRGATQLGAINPTALKALGLVAAVTLAVNLPVEIAIDGLSIDGTPSPLATFLSWTSIALGLVMQVAAAPYTAFGKDCGSWGAGDIMTTVFWALSFWPWIADTAFTALSPVKAVSEFVQVVGPIIDTFWGSILLLGGIATGIVDLATHDPGYTGWDTANDIVQPLPRTFKFLAALAQMDVEPITKEALLASLLLVDFATTAGGVVTQAGDSIYG